MLKISIIQSDLAWEKEKENLFHFSEQLKGCSNADLVLLPEAFTSGFSMSSERIADSTGRALAWMQEMAKLHDMAICGSVMSMEKERCVNRLLFVKPDGSYSHYDKRHLFTMGSEPEHYHPGRERLIIEYMGWRILPLVCYDLRFPVFSRNDCNYDLLLYVANWPAKRSHHWRSLLMARAIENQSYLAACNRIGNDANGIEYQGESQIIDYKGESLAEAGNNPSIIHAELSKEELMEGRAKFPVLDDADDFSADWK